MTPAKARLDDPRDRHAFAVASIATSSEDTRGDADVRRVVLANPKAVRETSRRAKTDKIDAKVLARLLAGVDARRGCQDRDDG